MSIRVGRTDGHRGVGEVLGRRRAMMERLEERRLLSSVLLSSGFGEGALQVAVDPYGAFGLVPTERATQFTDFTVGSGGVVDKSYVYFSPAGRFLTSSTSSLVPVLQPTAQPLPEVTFVSASERAAVSRFRLTGLTPQGEAYDYEIELLQELTDVTPTPITGFFSDEAGFQTTLVQQYRVTNLLGTAATFTMTRFMESLGVGFARGMLDGGRTVLTGGGPFEQHLLVRSFGGQLLGSAVGNPGLDAIIAEAGVLPPSQYGVVDGEDSDSDPESFVFASNPGLPTTFAQSSELTVGARQTVVFTTTSTFGTGFLIQTVNQFEPAELYTPVAGDFAFTTFEANYDFPQGSSGATPLTVTVTRLGGTRGEATAELTVLGASSTPAGSFSLSTTSVVFAEGQSTADVVITFNENLAGIEPSQLLIAVATATPDAGVMPPSTLAINVYPRRPALALSETDGVVPTYSAVQGDGTVDVTVYRRGLPNGPAAVTLRSLVGSASYADDILVEFADGETEKVVKLPIRTTDTGTTPLTVTLSLLPATAEGGLPSNVAGVPTTLTVGLRDTESPKVVGLATNLSRNRIASVVLTFSEGMSNAGNVSNYNLFVRSGETGFGAARLRSVPLVAASYDAAANTVTLVPQRALNLNTSYQVSARSSDQLTDLAGNPLLQTPGGSASYTAVFAQGRSVSYVDATGDLVRLRLSSGNLLLVRNVAGDSATLTLFGDGRPDAALTGSVTARRNSGGTTPLGQVLNPSNVAIDLPESFIV